MARKIATEKTRMKKNSIKVRAGNPTSAAAIEVTSVYLCANSDTDGFGWF
jgi:hypothetical protein